MNSLTQLFKENKPERVIEIINQNALEYCKSNPNVPDEDKEFFNLLQDLKNIAEQQLKELESKNN